MKKILLLLLSIIYLSGCKKYPEDPATIHLRSVKQRLTQRAFFTDQVKSISGNDYSGISGNDYINFFKSGNFMGEQSAFFGFNGNWEFIDKKNSIRIYNDYKSFTFQIIQLDASNLYLKNDTLTCRYHNNRP